MNKPIRVRFAPSPTGMVHIGSLRTALFNWLFARKMNGTCVLRVEDTDRTRYVEGSVENLLSTFSWLGIEFDEGPYIENFQFSISNFQTKKEGLILKERGNYGPYFQSQRLDIYKKYALELVEKSFAYWCECTPARLDEMRKLEQRQGLPPMYDGMCREKNLKSGLVIRLKVPRSTEETPSPNLSLSRERDLISSPPSKGERKREGVTFTTTFHDLIKGTVTVDNHTIDDQVLLKSDGFPTYHLAVVVDDHLMKISHVIRADEWLISTPKHVLIYKAFGWELPTFIHLPLILAPDKSKLSKRKGSVAVEEFRTDGYLPEALVNFVALLGWHPESDIEILSKDEVIKQFSLDRIQKSPAIFDRIKLDWMNGEYIRAMEPASFAEQCIPFLESAGLITRIRDQGSGIRENSKLSIIPNTLSVIPTNEHVEFDYIKKAVLTEQQRIKKLSDIGQGTEFFFKEPVYEPVLLVWKKSTKEETKENLQKLIEFVSRITNHVSGDDNTPLYVIPNTKPWQNDAGWTKEFLESKIKEWITVTGLLVGSVLWPMRVALTGRESSPGPFEVAAVLGKEVTLKRLQNAINVL